MQQNLQHYLASLNPISPTFPSFMGILAKIWLITYWQKVQPCLSGRQQLLRQSLFFIHHGVPL